MAARKPKQNGKSAAATSQAPRGALRAGTYVGWMKRVYKVLEPDPENPLVVRAEDIVSRETVTLAYVDLLRPVDDETDAPVFAGTLPVLFAALEARQIHRPNEAVARAATTARAQRTWVSLRERAGKMIEVVRAIDQALERDAAIAKATGERFLLTPATKAACAALPEPVTDGTYRRYRRACRAAGWNADRLAASLHRSTYNVSTLDPSVEHYMDTIILRFYSSSHPISLARIFDTHVKGYMRRTGTRWVDLDQCGRDAPEDLVDQLLDPKLDMDAILANEDHRSILKTIEPPKRSTFYERARWLVSEPDEGREIIIERYGREKWERERMVFDSFVHRASTLCSTSSVTISCSTYGRLTRPPGSSLTASGSPC